MGSTRILVFAGSIRRGALSGRLAACAAAELASQGATVTAISLKDYELPIYNGDLEKDEGVPENAKRLAREIVKNQGVFIATPEYNNSVPPLLKNAIDWVSRIKPSEVPYRDRVYGIGSSAAGPVGGARALIDLRKIVMPGLGGIVIPEKVEVGLAAEAFDEQNRLMAPALANLLKALCANLIAVASRIAA